MKVETGQIFRVLTYLDGFKEGDVFKVMQIDDEKAALMFEDGEELIENLSFIKKLDLKEIFAFSVVSRGETTKPAHYDTGIDTIAFMRANCPPEQVEGFLRGNALKYLQRYPNKNGVDDLHKAKHYVEMLIEELEGRG